MFEVMHVEISLPPATVAAYEEKGGHIPKRVAEGDHILGNHGISY